MPVYVFPELLAGLADELAARRQGKSCFNFRTISPLLLTELARLAKPGVDRFQKAGLLA